LGRQEDERMGSWEDKKIKNGKRGSYEDKALQGA
jgi:hypothetical protein